MVAQAEVVMAELLHQQAPQILAEAEVVMVVVLLVKPVVLV
jgi:hypothetical protein